MRMIHSRRKRVKPGRQNGVILEVGNSGPTFFVVIVMVSSQDVLDRISNLAEDMLKSMGMELVEAQYRREKKGFVLRLFIDRLPEFAGPLNELSGDSPSGSGVTLDDCVEVSRQFGRLLDVEDIIPGSYNLEVSSPGLDRPLTRPEHFTRFAGRDVAVRAIFEEGRRKIKGRLLGLTDGQVMLESGNETLTVPWDSIERVQLVPDVQWSRKD